MRILLNRSLCVHEAPVGDAGPSQTCFAQSQLKRTQYNQKFPRRCGLRPAQDAVPRVGKFLVLFSRPGQRVIVDYRGDILVRPTAHEIHIRNGEPAVQRAHCKPATTI